MPDFANDNKQPDREAPTGQPCPVCNKPGIHAYRPFCSRRCADVDLARWLGGSYAIPANPLDDEEEHVEIPTSHGERPSRNDG